MLCLQVVPAPTTVSTAATPSAAAGAAVVGGGGGGGAGMMMGGGVLSAEQLLRTVQIGNVGPGVRHCYSCAAHMLIMHGGAPPLSALVQCAPSAR